MSTEKKGKELLIGAVVGGVLGAAAALLFAPKSGRELRSDIAEGAQSVSQKTQATAKAVSTTTVDLVGKAKDTAVNVVETVRSWRGASTEEAEEIDDIEASEAAEDLVILGR
ncbi:YtxH domain-containing protein [Paenibacillus whitsoniae]|uniref:YtxH domain-containing protein n=1 Tax=Paenibacillus whitsoniae TaxID=2496558 RepID=A0A3S0ACW7_9BACL|nr:YtxH domain-containing protein [Paenibacillus whitsoniae]RTE10048.1 YtxH domain-containing protein [Paenibacillus whitsoniae]